MPSSERNSVLISGVVSFFQIHVQREYISAEDEENDYLYRMALEMHQRLRHEIQEQVRSTLGPEFQVQSLDIRKGSVTLLVAVSTAFGFYMGFSRYESFIKSANLLVSQLKGIVQRILGQSTNAGAGNLDVQGTWVPLAPITEAHNELSPAPRGLDSCRLLLFYVLTSHAALLAVFIWLLLHHL
jgi:hypothetical protein